MIDEVTGGYPGALRPFPASCLASGSLVEVEVAQTEPGLAPARAIRMIRHGDYRITLGSAQQPWSQATSEWDTILFQKWVQSRRFGHGRGG